MKRKAFDVFKKFHCGRAGWGEFTPTGARRQIPALSPAHFLWFRIFCARGHPYGGETNRP